jgi:signal transduction histidine kinase
MEDWKGAETDRERRTLRKLEVVAREVKRLQTILDDFLRFAGEHRLDRRPCRIEELVREVLDFLAPRLIAASVEPRTAFADDLPELLLDRNALKQVFLNLFLNAIQAMPSGGELMVRIAHEGGDVVVEVTDTGEGIPPDLLEKIWQVYYSRRRTGTGMGLPIARRYVEDHGGTISVWSEQGRGTRFAIRLPAGARREVGGG